MKTIIEAVDRFCAYPAFAWIQNSGLIMVLLIALVITCIPFLFVKTICMDVIRYMVITYILCKDALYFWLWKYNGDYPPNKLEKP